MLVDSIVNGSNIELEVKLQGQTLSFSSEVIMCIDNHILITPIKAHDQTLGFSEDCIINFLYKYDGKLYIWNNVDVRLIKYDGVVYHNVLLEGEGRRYNRRNAYRLHIGLDMPLHINSSGGQISISVLVKDISETGVAFITKEEFETGRTFRLKLRDGRTRFDLVGRIVRTEYLEHLGSNLYGCKLIEQNNALPKYIAKKQGEMLKMKNSYAAYPGRF